ncbi:MAG: hypothetical protein ABW278_15305 [Steroidobacteraceae bacterium]
MSNREVKGDDLVTTGERPGPGSSERFADWAARVQRGGRHAAINRNLNTWANYKNWSEKARLSWDSDVAVKIK